MPVSCPGVQTRQDSFKAALYPGFPFVQMGKNWFQNQGRWQGAGSMPSPGAIIFLTGITMERVTMGIVERCDGTTVYTIRRKLRGCGKREKIMRSVLIPLWGYGMVVY